MLSWLRFGIIDRYIGKTVLTYVILATIVLTIITGIITFIDQTRNLGRGNIDFAFLLLYVMLRLPASMVMLFPVAVLLGGVLGLGILSKNSELVVMQSSGMSKAQVIFSACKMLLPLVLVVTALGQSVVPEIERYAEDRFNYYSSEGRVQRTSWGVWVREGDSFISIRLVTSDNILHDITRYDFEGSKLKSISRAATGLYNNGKWDMRNVHHASFYDKKILFVDNPLEKWELYITPERLNIFNLNSNDLSLGKLIDYIDYLENNAIDSSRYRVSLYKKLMLPVTIIVMLLLASLTVFGSLRSVPLSARILLGLAIGFMFYMANEIMPNFTLVYGLSPLLGVLMPNVIFAVVSLIVLERRV